MPSGTRTVIRIGGLFPADAIHPVFARGASIGIAQSPPLVWQKISKTPAFSPNQDECRPIESIEPSLRVRCFITTGMATL